MRHPNFAQLHPPLPFRVNQLQTCKGCLCIVVTATLVYWLLRKHGSEIEQYNENIKENEAQERT